MVYLTEICVKTGGLLWWNFHNLLRNGKLLNSHFVEVIDLIMRPLFFNPSKFECYPGLEHMFCGVCLYKLTYSWKETRCWIWVWPWWWNSKCSTVHGIITLLSREWYSCCTRVGKIWNYSLFKSLKHYSAVLNDQLWNSVVWIDKLMNAIRCCLSFHQWKWDTV